jgi:hypothetical protein
MQPPKGELLLKRQQKSVDEVTSPAWIRKAEREAARLQRETELAEELQQPSNATRRPGSKLKRPQLY